MELIGPGDLRFGGVVELVNYLPELQCQGIDYQLVTIAPEGEKTIFTSQIPGNKLILNTKNQRVQFSTAAALPNFAGSHPPISLKFQGRLRLQLKQSSWSLPVEFIRQLPASKPPALQPGDFTVELANAKLRRSQKQMELWLMLTASGRSLDKASIVAVDCQAIVAGQKVTGQSRVARSKYDGNNKTIKVLANLPLIPAATWQDSGITKVFAINGAIKLDVSGQRISLPFAAKKVLTPPLPELGCAVDHFEFSGDWRQLLLRLTISENFIVASPQLTAQYRIEIAGQKAAAGSSYLSNLQIGNSGKVGELLVDLDPGIIYDLRRRVAEKFVAVSISGQLSCGAKVFAPFTRISQQKVPGVAPTLVTNRPPEQATPPARPKEPDRRQYRLSRCYRHNCRR